MQSESDNSREGQVREPDRIYGLLFRLLLGSKHGFSDDVLRSPRKGQCRANYGALEHQSFVQRYHGQNLIQREAYALSRLWNDFHRHLHSLVEFEKRH